MSSLNSVNSVSPSLAKDCLLEIGCEELPTAALQPLTRALAEQLENQFIEAELTFSAIESFVTPRRIAVLVKNLTEHQPDRFIEQLGPPVNQAYDNQGNPTTACIGFARTCGIDVNQLIIKDTPKGQRVSYTRQQTGMSVIELLPHFIQKALGQLPITKPMRWADHHFTFARPVHWVVLLYGERCIQAQILGVNTGPYTYGHRFLHPGKLLIASPEQYSESLAEKGYVLVGFAERKSKIISLINQSLMQSEQAFIDEALLDEVTALVEWPVALRGQFKQEFLSIPQEVLMASMQTHQKCFPVLNQDGQLKPAFIVISNLVSQNPQAVIQGNERVINARLSDAAFFFAKDCQHPLQDLAPKLHHVTFQQQLGTLAEKTERLVKLSELIARQIDADVLVTGQAAALSKCDLLSEMVGEFPQLQGVMGYYYALNDHLSKQCAVAIKQHYWPRFAGDQLPDNLEGCALALADRLDSLVGILGINQTPTGDKDPFGLRRMAFGICRLLIEKSLPLDLPQLLIAAQENYSRTVRLPNIQVVEEAYQFILQRLKSWYFDKEVSLDIFNAVAACRPTSLLDFDRRIQAIIKFKNLPEAETLAAANKRVSNILKKQQEALPTTINDQLLTLPAERELSRLLTTYGQTINEYCQKGQYQQALSLLATFKPSVDDFFDNVMVMVDDRDLRLNRLSLLSHLRQLFTQIADIALLQ